MTYEKAKEIICDAIFNGEYRATEEQEEAYFTIFHKGRQKEIDEEELDRLAKEYIKDKIEPSIRLASFNGFRAGYIAFADLTRLQTTS